jgi:hypothetical protein
MNHPHPELNPCCFQMYVKSFQTVFRRGQRWTDLSFLFHARIDISYSQTLEINFYGTDLCVKYPDCSELYKCEISGPPNLEDYSTGIVKWPEGQTPLILIFHHTSKENREKILKCEYFLPSFWNIQGTKKVKNVGYIYLTCLPKLDCDNCLVQVAMSSEGKVYMNIDNPPPKSWIFADLDLTPESEDSCNIEVYRENTESRTYSLDFLVDPSQLAPNHLIRHYDQTGHQIFYEVISAFIYRIGIDPNSVLKFNRKTFQFNYDSSKNFNYIIIGDGWKKDGLVAPFDEENTKFKAKIECVSKESNILEFWFDNNNANRFDNLNPEEMKF